MTHMMEQMTLPGLEETAPFDSHRQAQGNAQGATVAGKSRWPMVKLGDVCTLVTKGTTPTTLGFSFTDEGNPFLRAQNLVDGKVDIAVDPLFIDDKTNMALSRSIIQPDDVLIAIAGTIGRTALVQSAISKANCNQAVAILRSSPMLLPAYLQLILHSDSVVQQIYNSKVTATISNLSLGEIKKLDIPLPPLPEQQRIVARLDQAQQLIDQRKEQLALMDALVQSLFYEMFGDPVKNEKGWEVRELKEIVKEGTIVTYGIVQAGDEFPDGVPYIRTGDISNGMIIEDGLRHTDPKIAEKFARSRVETGEIVMSIRATVGTTALVKPSLDGANLTQGTARISPGKNTNNLFLLYFLRTSGTQLWISQQVKGATFREITLAKLRELPVFLPPLPLQQTFANRVQQIETLKQQMMASLAELEQNFQALMQEAFGG